MISAVEDLDEVFEQYHLAIGEFMKGNPEPAKRMFSHHKTTYAYHQYSQSLIAIGFTPFTSGWKDCLLTPRCRYGVQPTPLGRGSVSLKR